jgi:hypothetical protein
MTESRQFGELSFTDWSGFLVKEDLSSCRTALTLCSTLFSSSKEAQATKLLEEVVRISRKNHWHNLVSDSVQVLLRHNKVDWARKIYLSHSNESGALTTIRAEALFDEARALGFKCFENEQTDLALDYMKQALKFHPFRRISEVTTAPGALDNVLCRLALLKFQSPKLRSGPHLPQ